MGEVESPRLDSRGVRRSRGCQRGIGPGGLKGRRASAEDGQVEWVGASGELEAEVGVGRDPREGATLEGDGLRGGAAVERAELHTGALRERETQSAGGGKLGRDVD